jgi:hypothetical protein
VSHTAQLNLPGVPTAACNAHLFPNLQQKALLSICQFCDQGYTATFTNSKVTINHPWHVTIQGYQQTNTGLWIVNLNAPNTDRKPTKHNKEQANSVNHDQHIQQQANSVYDTTSKTDLVQYLHQSCFSPTASAFTKAIDKGFLTTTWPGLTSNLVRKHQPKLDATVKGHLRQKFKNIRSTKPKPATKQSQAHHNQYQPRTGPTTYMSQPSKQPAKFTQTKWDNSP